MGGCLSAPKEEEEPSTDITEKPPPRRSSIKLATAEALSSAVQQTLLQPHVHRKTSTGGGEFTAAELAVMRAKHEGMAPKEKKRPSMVQALAILKSNTWYTDEYATVDRPEWANAFIELLQRKARVEMKGTEDDNTAFLMVVAAMKVRFVELKHLLSAAPSSPHVDPEKDAAITEIVDMQDHILEDFNLLKGQSDSRKVNIGEESLRPLWYRMSKRWMEDDGQTFTDPTAKGQMALVPSEGGPNVLARKGGGEWKAAEATVLDNVVNMVQRWGDDDLVRFVTEHKPEICPDPKLPGAHSIYYNELESLFDDAGNYEDHWQHRGVYSGHRFRHADSHTYGKNDYSDQLPVMSRSGEYYGLMVGGLFGAVTMVFIVVVFCVGLALGMFSCWGYMQQKALEKAKEEEMYLKADDAENDL